MTAAENKTVLVGMSGGVDSTVAVLLLQERGYRVQGATLRIWHEEPARTDRVIESARASAGALGIPHHVIDVGEDFYGSVVAPFIRAYAEGLTPNPCVLCNPTIKFASLLSLADQLGVGYIATGHYARITRYPATGRYAIQRAVSLRRDQSYMLYALSQAQLQRLIFPLGEYGKDAIREKAEANGLTCADTPASQEICFLTDQDYGRFIRERCPELFVDGNIVDTGGNVLGRHEGIIHFTIGQRKGLGIAAGKPMYVCDIDKDTHRVIVGDDADLFRRKMRVGDLRYMAVPDFDAVTSADIKIRHQAKPAPARLRMEDGCAEVTFDTPQRAITPGQSAVFYHGDTVLGGGVIL